MNEISNVLRDNYNLTNFKYTKHGQDYILKSENGDKFFLISIDEYAIRTLKERVKLYKICKENSIHNHEIIYTKNGQITIKYLKKKYILVKFGKNSSIINSINLNNQLFKLHTNNWDNLWAMKVDYLESLYAYNKVYNPLNTYFDYFIGLSENAISKFKAEKKLLNNKLVVQHKRYDKEYFNDNPFNLVIDYRVRDIAEKIKYKYIYCNFNYTDLKKMVKFGNYTKQELRLALIRITYPSIFFDLYIKSIGNAAYILDEQIEEKLNNYPRFLKRVSTIFKREINKKRI